MLTSKRPMGGIAPKNFSRQVLTPTSATVKANKMVPKPISDLKLGMMAQRKALEGLKPTSAEEAHAKESQLAVLNRALDLETEYSEATIRLNIASNIGAISALNNTISAANLEAQLKNACTDTNREKLINSVKYGVDMWRLQAHFANIQIMGQSAIGVPGCLQGPDLKPWILQAPSVYNSTGLLKTLADSVADAVSTNFKQWADFVTVPGLPWYPMFVAVASPFAPPTPNIPMPLVVCVSQNFSKLASPIQVETAIKSRLPDNFRIAEMDMFVYILSVHLANYFMQWMSSQNVMMVMGMGPVPTFNPPYVPVGPVVSGYVIPSPGHLAA